jgi:PAS domain S-box-containing protein
MNKTKRSSQDLLRLVDEGTASATGAEFFRALVHSLARALAANCAFVSEFSADLTRVDVLAYWVNGEFGKQFSYDIKGTPCESVLNGEIAAFGSGIAELFPADRAWFEQIGAESFLAIPMADATGKLMGHLAALAPESRDWQETDFGVLRIFAARAAAEIGRLGAERALQRANEDLEKRVAARTADLEQTNARLAAEVAERSRAQAALQAAHDELEERVSERTAALSEANRMLNLEIERRAAVEDALRASEESYRGMYEDAPDIYWSTGVDGRLRSANRRASELFGYTREELIGMPLMQLAADTPHGRPKARRVYERFLRGEATFGEEVEFVSRDGRSIWCSVAVRPYRNAAGEIEATRSILTDITERRRIELALEHRLAIERLITTVSTRFVGSAPEHFEEELKFALRAVAEFSGSQRSFIYRLRADGQMARLVHQWADDGAPALPPLDDCLDRDRLARQFAPVLSGEILLHPQPGAAPSAEVRDPPAAPPGIASRLALPIGHGEEVIGIFGLDDFPPERIWPEEDLKQLRLLAEIMANALARRDAEAALHHAIVAAETASRAKSDFLANMSHELRTPLNSVLGYAQLLERDARLDAQQCASVQAIRRSGEYLLDLINDVLDLARIEAGKLKLYDEVVDLGDFLEDIASSARLRATHAGLAFGYETRSELPPAIRVDTRKLRQILLNLLSNAIKFTRSGQIWFRVTARDRAPDGATELHFEIEDTGIGIAEADLARIFEPFWQIRDAGRPVEGTGLGLSITRNLVAAMGGQLDVRSRPGAGSRFTVTLAVPKVAARTGASGRGPRVVGYHGPVRRLLIADDKPDNRNILAGLLAPLGFEVHEVADGQAALEAIARIGPDLVLMDLVMPGLDGFETIRQLRSRPATKSLKIIAISASAFDHKRRESFDAGADDFVAKPVDVEVLLDRLCHHLGLSWRYDAEAARTGTPAEAALRFDRHPPKAALERLRELAMTGDVMAMREELDVIEAQHPQCADFVTALRAMVINFDMKRIRSLLQDCAGMPA